ncbi:MAG: 4Fe-4S dicluster domain-containing protein [Candidatus Electrothrix sp. AR4]|nr:4Fe-4S dicluster domain-containing protein [Candidatus Electrothrix sp. AR4]
MTFQVDRDDGLFYRQTLFDQARIVVLKVGSAVLTTQDGLNLDFIDTLCRQIAFLRSSGREVILVSSGAVAAGRQRLEVRRQPGEELRVKQALAAIGQGLLMHAYEQCFAQHDKQQVAQILLTHCIRCKRCIAVCPYGARSFDAESDQIVVDSATCQACGMCAVTCQNSAAEVRGWNDKQMLSMIDAQLMEYRTLTTV